MYIVYIYTYTYIIYYIHIYIYIYQIISTINRGPHIVDINVVGPSSSEDSIKHQPIFWNIYVSLNIP